MLSCRIEQQVLIEFQRVKHPFECILSWAKVGTEFNKMGFISLNEGTLKIGPFTLAIPIPSHKPCYEVEKDYTCFGKFSFHPILM